MSIKVIYNPYEQIDFSNANSYKTELHSHTDFSDGTVTPKQKFETCIEYGFDILAITDHDGYTRARRASYPHDLGDGVEPIKYDGGSAMLYSLDGHDILYIEGMELGRKSHHRTSLFNNMWSSEEDYQEYGDGDTEMPVPELEKVMEYTFKEVQRRGGLMFLNHPGRYDLEERFDGWTPEWYANLFRRHPHVLGMEIINANNRYPQDVARWDSVLEKALPQRNVWCFSNSDDHFHQRIGASYNIILAESLHPSDIKNALIRGEFYAVYDEGGNDLSHHNPIVAPKITSVGVTEYSISIDGSNFNKVEWYSMGSKIHEGNSIDLNNPLIGSYVRAQLIGDNSVSYTQPFVIGKGVSIERIAKKIYIPIV